MRNLTKTLTAVSLLVPASAYPLGIGDIKLHSALNQNLNAEIALIVSAGENVSDLQVRLAPPEKFDEAGVPWSYFLSKIKFEAVVKNGTAFVKLSSQEALREPFLDFLLEVTWPKGNLYREFTVLVDPPVAYTQPVVPVVEQAQQSAPVTLQKKSVNNTQTVSKATVSVGDYGPTRRTDNLWKVAERTNTHNDVSIEQMMMAIYEANPKAFFKENVNALKAGQTLDIPEREVILKLSKKAALSAFREQNRIWKGKVASKKTVQQAAVPPAELSTQLELEAPVEAEIAETVVVVSDTETPADVTSVGTGQEKPGIESSEASMALQAKMEKLEQQLTMMQNMLALKDEQIAALQSQEKSATELIGDSKTAKAGENQEKTDPLNKDSKTLLAETGTGKTDIAKTATVEKSKPKPKPKPKVKPKVKKKLKPVVVEPETDYLSWILGLVGAGIIAMFGLLFWRKRKIEQEIDTESMFASASEISLPDSATGDSGFLGGDDESTSYDVGTVGESSFLSEFTPSDFDAFDTDQNEVDPISEADVYLAYGRYQQAEDLMRQAIEDQPDRDECKTKLFEIFYANENKEAFSAYAAELASAGKNEDHGFWSKISEMGAEIDPDSSLYGAKANFDSDVLDDGDTDLSSMPAKSNSDETVVLDTAEADTTVQVEESSAETEMDFDLSIFEQNDEPELAPESANTEDDQQENIESAEDDAGLDFDFTALDEDVSDDQNNEVEQTESIEFNVEDDDDATELAAEVSAGAEAVEEEIESFDFDLGEMEAETEGDEIDLSAAADDLESIDFSESTDESSVAESVDDAIEEFDFDFDTDTETKEESAPSIADSLDHIDLGVSDLTDTDELETKIDLAKAYVDMGDLDAAKNIAEEVLDKGTEEQKAAAQSIIDQLK